MPTPSATATEHNWRTARNWNSADTKRNQQVLSGRHFPVLGNVSTGGYAYDGDPYDAKGGSSFCGITYDENGNNTRTYINNACDNATGAHRGEDIMPPAGYRTPGIFPIVAMYRGKVTRANCADGAGWQVQVQGTDGRYYHYVHLHKNPLVNEGQVVDTGQLLGYMGNTNTYNSSKKACGSTGLGTHLHFEIREGATNHPENDPIDPYLTLRAAYAWVGRQANGDIDGSFVSALVDANQYYSSLTDKLLNVGWTGGGKNSSNVRTTYSARWKVGGEYQWLYVGTEKWSADKRSGVIAKRDGLSAYVVPRTVWIEYRRHNHWWGWLGFPTSHFRPGIQYFQGGCIFHNGKRFVAGDYSLNACKRGPYL